MSGLLTLNKDHEYHLDGLRLPSVTQIMKSVGLIDDRFFDDYSRDRGTLVHLACQFYDEETLDESDLDPVIVPYMEAWKKFRADNAVKVGIIEESYPSKLGFAGTLDRVFCQDELIDIKTGTPNWTTGVQIAGYQILHEENVGPIRARKAVQLKNDGTYKIHHYRDRADRNVFLGALAVVNARINHGGYWNGKDI